MPKKGKKPPSLGIFLYGSIVCFVSWMWIHGRWDWWVLLVVCACLSAITMTYVLTQKCEHCGKSLREGTDHKEHKVMRMLLALAGGALVAGGIFLATTVAEKQDKLNCSWAILRQRQQELVERETPLHGFLSGLTLFLLDSPGKIEDERRYLRNETANLVKRSDLLAIDRCASFLMLVLGLALFCIRVFAFRKNPEANTSDLGNAPPVGE